MILIIISFLSVKLMYLNAIQSVYMTWIMVLIAVGLHFFAFIPVHGKIIGILGIVTILNGLIGILAHFPLDMIFVSDGVIKMIFGLIYLKVSPINF
ncbi:DUF6609 family protein [Companilactobacillus nantensis]|nr:DUF6609 family protein [Companilactobacillus nantensis]